MYQGQPTGRTHLATGTSWEEANLGSLLARGRTGYLGACIAPCAPTPTHPGPQVPQEHKTERALGRIGSYGEGRRSAVQQPSLWLSPHPRTSPASFMVVCLWPHSNNGGRRSCGSSRRESSAGTTRSRCAGRRRGGARSTSRYSGPGAHSWPQRELQRQLTVPGAWVTVS